MNYVMCSSCGKRVSNYVKEEMFVRAYVECPECIEKQDEAGASAERISSVVRCCQNSEDILKETIENALYSTGNFTIEQCTDLAEGLILFIRDSFKNKSAIAHNAASYPTCDLQGACAGGQGATATQRVSTVICRYWRKLKRREYRTYERQKRK